MNIPPSSVIRVAAFLLSFPALLPAAAHERPDLRPPTGVSASGGWLVLRYPGHRTAIVAGVQGASEPALSPDKHFVAYVQAASGAKISTGQDDVDPNQVWLLDTVTLKTTRLVVSRPSDDMKQVLGGLSHPVFSANGQQVFFLSSAWATSDAVHAVDLRTRTVRFVCDGSTLSVLRTGRYRGDLVVNKHKYRPNAGGAYDFDWLVSPSGREIKLWSRSE